MILSSLCACWTPAVLRFSRIIWTKLRCSPPLGFRRLSISSSFSSTPRTRWGERLSTVNGPGDADLLVVFVWLIVQVLVLGFGGDGCIDFFLARDAVLPTIQRAVALAWRATCRQLRAGSPILPRTCFRAVFERVAQRFQRLWHCSQITSISALLAMDFSVMCGTRS